MPCSPVVGHFCLTVHMYSMGGMKTQYAISLQHPKLRAPPAVLSFPADTTRLSAPYWKGNRTRDERFALALGSKVNLICAERFSLYMLLLTAFHSHDFDHKRRFSRETLGFPYKGDTGLDGISKLRKFGESFIPAGVEFIRQSNERATVEVCGSVRFHFSRCFQ